MSNLTPSFGNPAAAAHARAVLTNPQLCASNPTIVPLAWAVLRSNTGLPPVIQSRLPRPQGSRR